MDFDYEKKFERDGLQFRMRVIRDPRMGEPWKVYDGHGVITDWTTRPKHPWERVLVSDGESHRYYDIQGTTQIAKRDKWGIDPKKAQGKTGAEITIAAVEEDYARMKAWCDDEWWWVTIWVDLLDLEGSPINRREYWDELGGIESDSGDAYLMEVAGELAADIAEKVKGQDAVNIPIRRKRDSE